MLMLQKKRKKLRLQKWCIKKLVNFFLINKNMGGKRRRKDNFKKKAKKKEVTPGTQVSQALEHLDIEKVSDFVVGKDQKE